MILELRLDDRIDDSLRGLVLVGPEVTVRVQRGLRRRMPQPGLHGLHVGPIGDEQRGEVVPSFRSRRVQSICVAIRAGRIRVVKFASVMMSRVAIPAAAV
jgi:hypothetical protein